MNFLADEGEAKAMVLLNRAEPQESKMPTIRATYRADKKKLLKDVFLKVAKRLAIYYPDKADYYSSPDFLMLFMEEVQSQQPHIYAEEVFTAISAGLRDQKIYGWPKLSDLMEWVRVYVEKRAGWIEHFEQNAKFDLNKVPDTVLQVFKAVAAEIKAEDEQREAKFQAERDQSIKARQEEIKARNEAENEYNEKKDQGGDE